MSTNHRPYCRYNSTSEQNKLISAGAQSVQLKPIDEIDLINTILESLGGRHIPKNLSSGGMLASVLPADLKQAISQNLDSLENCLLASEQMKIRPLIHDLLGFVDYTV